MPALQKVFDTILQVLEMIKKFFTDLFPQKEEDGDAAEGDNAEA